MQKLSKDARACNFTTSSDIRTYQLWRAHAARACMIRSTAEPRSMDPFSILEAGLSCREACTYKFALLHWSLR